MQWTRLSRIGVERWFSKSLRAKAESLNAQIEQLLENRKQLETAIANQANVDVASADFNNLVGFPTWRLSIIELLQGELVLRRNLAAFWEPYYSELAAAHVAAAKAYEDAQAEIRQKLLDLGYHEPQSGVPDPSRLQPGWILCHPKVREAKGEMDSLRSRQTARDHQRANDAAIEKVTQLLETLRTGALPT